MRRRVRRTGLAALLLAAGVLPSAASTRHPTLVTVEGSGCATCHGDLIEERASVHAAAVDDCTNCHEFSHGEQGLVVSLLESEPALCVMCHDDKEAAASLEHEVPHYPAGDSCLTCHDPHAADQAPLLAMPVTELCAECHDRAELQSVHGNQLTDATDCGLCHQPHGGKTRALLRASRLHVPFADGSCSGCHRDPSGTRVRLRVRGERLCEACHGEFSTPAGGSRHAALEGRGQRAGCISCHSPHMSDQRALLVDKEPSLCRSCHSSVVAGAEAETGHFAAADSCLSCHQPHVADHERLLTADTTELCATCHDLGPQSRVMERVELDLTGAGRFEFGPAVIVPAAEFDNGTPNPGLCLAPFPPGTWNGEIVLCERGQIKRVLKGQNVRAGGAGGFVLANRPEGASDLFADAHVIPAIHLSAAEAARLGTWLGAANAPARARIDGPRLWLERTEPARAATSELVATHLGADLERLDCVSCHSPHGAGHPALLAEHLHPPVEDGCDTCHEGAFDELAEGGAPDLCVMCHDEITEAVAAAAVPHEALELGSCTDCHNPHASAQEKLVSSPAAGPCADCHDEQVAGLGEVAHPVIDLVGCRACHEPHGGSKETMLRQTGPELCLACHGASGPMIDADEGAALLLDRFRIDVGALGGKSLSILQLSRDGLEDHPVTNHRVLGKPTEEELSLVRTSFREEFTCLTCHDPHKGRSWQLFRWNAESTEQVCRECHEK